MSRMECSALRLSVSILVLTMCLAVAFSSHQASAAKDAQQGQPSGTQADQQNQTGNQDQSQEKSKKKKTSFWGDVAGKVSGSSSQQTSETAAATTKGVGDEDGQKIAAVTPTAADQQAVKAMESYALPQGALPKFIEGGHLKPKQ